MPDPQQETPPGAAMFGEFRVETETMPDGRRIHYYAWPDDTETAASAGDPADVQAAHDAADSDRV
jgi:hypothetical protein